MTTLLNEFQLFRQILCICPCCGDLVRISDVKLKAKRTVSRTWLDSYEAKEQKLAKREEAFEEEEQKLRGLAREKGRKAAERVFLKAVCLALRALKINPLDIKPIFHPIDFLVFNGMSNEEAIRDIILLTRQHDCPSINPMRRQIKKAVFAKKYDWQVARINDNGNIVFE